MPVRLAVEPSVVLWIPEMSTSTRRSRATLPSTVSFGDATFNVGRTALLVAALAAGDVEALRTATEDRLHQDVRFAASVPSRLALAVGLEAGAWAGWLSGSGPSVALMCAPSDAERLAAALTDRVEDGRAVVTTVDHTGATVEDRPVPHAAMSDEWSYDAHCSSRRPRRHRDERCAPLRHSSLIAQVRRIGRGGGGQAAGEHEGLVGEEAWHGSAWCGRVGR